VLFCIQTLMLCGNYTSFFFLFAIQGMSNQWVVSHTNHSVCLKPVAVKEGWGVSWYSVDKVHRTMFE